MNPPLALALRRRAGRLASAWTSVIGGVLLLAGIAVVAAPAPHEVSAVGAASLAVALLGGGSISVDLPYRAAGSTRFTLAPTALVAGVLLRPPLESAVAVLLAALVATVVTGRTARRVEIANEAAASLLAILVVQALAADAAPVDAGRLGAALAGVGVAAWVSALASAGTRAAEGAGTLADALGRLAPVAASLAVTNACLGIVAVLLVLASPWALAALAVPVVVLISASRADVAARVDAERTAGLLALEQRLAGAADRAAVASAAIEGVDAVLGASAGVWAGGPGGAAGGPRRWYGDVPDGAEPCPVAADREDVVLGTGADLGLGAQERAAAVGAGVGALVAWGDAVVAEATPWIERIGQATRAAFARVEAVEALERERSTLGRVVEATADGILVVADGRVTACNPAMAALARVPADQAVGRRADELLGEGPWDEPGVHTVTRRASGRVWRVAVAPAGALSVAVVHDVTAAIRAARTTDDLLSVVSHELRTPLTPITASAQLLLRRWHELDDERRTFLLQQIAHRSDHLARLVEDLLLVGQLSSGEPPTLHLIPADLAAVVRDAVHDLPAACAGHPLSLGTDAALIALCDPLRVAQVVHHLVGNACTYSPAGTPVDVALRRDGTDAALTVDDRGPGVPVGDRERVFDRFRRLEDPLVMRTSGAGLGLPIVRGIVEAMGGSVRLEDAPSGGARAIVRLPLLRVDADGDAESSGNGA